MTYREPEFLPWQGKSVPLTLLGGYLGAGKTTVINELLGRTQQPIAVLVNDVGAVNVDAALIRRRSAETIEFTDGCVCCSLSGGLGPAFDQLRELATPPAHVILELSGVANPDRVRPWGKSAGFRLDGVVVLVDSDQYFDLMGHETTKTILELQIKAADLLVLTKTDLISKGQRRRVMDDVTSLAPDTTLLSSPAALATAGLLELGANTPRDRATAQPESPPVSLFDLHEVQTVPLPAAISVEDLTTLVNALPPSVIRAKGIAVSPEGQPLLVQVVGKRRIVSELPEAEHSEPTDLVVITLSAPND